MTRLTEGAPQKATARSPEPAECPPEQYESHDAQQDQASADGKPDDEHDGFEGRKREEIYKLFSELAGHPTNKSMFMLRPDVNGPALTGPFMEFGTLQSVLSEMGRLAAQIGEIVARFFPKDWHEHRNAMLRFNAKKADWIDTFYTD